MRASDGSWRLTEADGSAAMVHLPTIGCTLPLAEVYEQVALAE